MSKKPVHPVGATPPAVGMPSPATANEHFARTALSLNGVSLSDAEVVLVSEEFQRALEIIGPLLDFTLPDGLDQAGVYRP